MLVHIFVGQPTSFAVFVENLLNTSGLNLNWLIVGNLFHDKFLDALEFDVGDFFLVCKFLNDFGSLDEKLSRIVVIRGHAQDFLVVLQDAREVAADDSLLLHSLFLAFGLYEFEL